MKGIMKHFLAATGPTPSLSKDEALRFASKSSFEAFDKQFLKSKKDRSDVDVVKSPYDVAELARAQWSLPHNVEFAW